MRNLTLLGITLIVLALVAAEAVRAQSSSTDCLTGRSTFADGPMVTISGMRSGQRVAETYVRDHDAWMLWMRYRNEGAEQPERPHAYRCPSQPLPSIAPAAVDWPAGSLTPELAEAFWLSLLRSGDAATLRAAQIRAFSGIDGSGRTFTLDQEVAAMRKRPYQLLANCLGTPAIARSTDIATIHAPYREYLRVRGHLVEVRYDSTDTFVRRHERWFASAGFARSLGYAVVKSIPEGCTPNGQADVALQTIAKELSISAFGLAILRHGTVVHEFLSGASRHTLFQIGSVTKMMTAAALVGAAQRSGVKLDAPIDRFIAGLPACLNDVSAGQLLSDGAGIVDVPGADGPHSGTDTVRMLQALGDASCLMPAGLSFSYSNAGYALAGTLLANLEHSSYESAMTHTLFKPLGFVDSTFDATLAQDRDHAVGIEASSGKPVASYADDIRLRPAGYLNASLADVERFVGAMQTNALPDGATTTLQQSRIEIPALFEAGSYGYGLIVRNDRGEHVIEHGGDMPGFSSFVRLLPQRGLAFVLLVARDGIPMPEIVDSIDRQITARLATRERAVEADRLVEEDAARAWAGRYVNGTRFALTLFLSGNQLHLAGLGPERTVYLRPEGGFVAMPGNVRLSPLRVGQRRYLRFGLWTLAAQ